MSNLNLPTKNLSQIIEEFREIISPGELQDIMESVKLLKRGSGWGSVTVQFLNSDVDNIEIKVTRKRPKKQ